MTATPSRLLAYVFWHWKQAAIAAAREFCLHADEPVALPVPFMSLGIPLRQAWRES